MESNSSVSTIAAGPPHLYEIAPAIMLRASRAQVKCDACDATWSLIWWGPLFRGGLLPRVAYSSATAASVERRAGHLLQLQDGR